MSSFISIMNVKANRAKQLNWVLGNSKISFLSFEVVEGKLYPNCIRIIITEEDKKEELTTDLHYNETLKAYNYNQINRTCYPKYQTIAVEVLVDEKEFDKNVRYNFTIIIKEDGDDEGDGYFTKVPKSSPGTTLSSKYLERVE